jgi:hypothetical protein
MASAVRMVSCAWVGPMETATTSVATPFSLMRTASSTAISSKGFIDILTLASSTPDCHPISRDLDVVVDHPFDRDQDLHPRKEWSEKQAARQIQRDREGYPTGEAAPAPVVKAAAPAAKAAPVAVTAAPATTTPEKK